MRVHDGDEESVGLVGSAPTRPGKNSAGLVIRGLVLLTSAGALLFVWSRTTGTSDLVQETRWLMKPERLNRTDIDDALHKAFSEPARFVRLRDALRVDLVAPLQNTTIFTARDDLQWSRRRPAVAGVVIRRKNAPLWLDLAFDNHVSYCRFHGYDFALRTGLGR